MRRNPAHYLFPTRHVCFKEALQLNRNRSQAKSPALLLAPLGDRSTGDSQCGPGIANSRNRYGASVTRGGKVLRSRLGQGSLGNRLGRRGRLAWLRGGLLIRPGRGRRGFRYRCWIDLGLRHKHQCRSNGTLHRRIIQLGCPSHARQQELTDHKRARHRASDSRVCPAPRSMDKKDAIKGRTEFQKCPLRSNVCFLLTVDGDDRFDIKLELKAAENHLIDPLSAGYTTN